MKLLEVLNLKIEHFIVELFELSLLVNYLEGSIVNVIDNLKVDIYVLVKQD